MELIPWIGQNHFLNLRSSIHEVGLGKSKVRRKTIPSMQSVFSDCKRDSITQTESLSSTSQKSQKFYRLRATINRFFQVVVIPKCLPNYNSQQKAWIIREYPIQVPIDQIKILFLQDLFNHLPSPWLYQTLTNLLFLNIFNLTKLTNK